MAISGKLEADFATFYQAVDESTIRLRRFDAGAAQVETSLSRMVDNFTGRKIIAEATLMAEAVERIGGAAKLTDAELQKVARTASEAVAKFDAMGREAPANIRNLANELKTGEGALSSMAGSVSSLAGAFGIAFSVGTVVNFTRSLFDAADALQKQSDMTGISVEALQRLEFVGSETGVSMDTFTRAIDQMEKRLASGDKNALAALKAMHVSLDDIRTLSPEQRFYAIAAALKDVSTQGDQVNDAMALFGRGGAEALPAIKRGFDDVRDAAIGMSRDTVQALDDIGDRAGHAWQRFKGDAGNAFEFLFLGWSKAERDAKDYAKTIEDIYKQAVTRAPALPTLPGATGVAPGISASEERTLERELAEDLREQGKILAINKREMEEFLRNEYAAFEIGQRLIASGSKLLDEQNAKMEKRLELQTAFVASLIQENAQAKDVNIARNLGPGIADPAAAAAAKRDAELRRISDAQARAPGLDLSALIQKTWQDFDAMILGGARPGGAAAGPPVQVNVSGVMDPRTISELTDAISTELMRRSGRR
jgi:hypothetical protein